MATRRSGTAAAASAKPTQQQADAAIVDGAFGPSQDPDTPDLIWVPFDGERLVMPTSSGRLPAEVHPWPDNPRINGKTVQRVAASLARFGWVRPLVANTFPGLEGELIIGHTARLAALANRAAGDQRFGQAPVRFRRMPPVEAHAAALADNRLNEFSEWDLEPLGRLAVELGAPLFDIAGWDAESHSRLSNLETGGFLGGMLGGSGDAAGGPANDRANSAGLSTLSFHVSLADKTTVLNALALMGKDIPASLALVQLCKEKIRAAKRK